MSRPVTVWERVQLAVKLLGELERSAAEAREQSAPLRRIERVVSLGQSVRQCRAQLGAILSYLSESAPAVLTRDVQCLELIGASGRAAYDALESEFQSACRAEFAPVVGFDPLPECA